MLCLQCVLRVTGSECGSDEGSIWYDGDLPMTVGEVLSGSLVLSTSADPATCSVQSFPASTALCETGYIVYRSVTTGYNRIAQSQIAGLVTLRIWVCVWVMAGHGCDYSLQSYSSKRKQSLSMRWTTDTDPVLGAVLSCSW